MKTTDRTTLTRVVLCLGFVIVFAGFYFLLHAETIVPLTSKQVPRTGTFYILVDRLPDTTRVLSSVTSPPKKAVFYQVSERRDDVFLADCRTVPRYDNEVRTALIVLQLRLAAAMAAEPSSLEAAAGETLLDGSLAALLGESGLNSMIYGLDELWFEVALTNSGAAPLASIVIHPPDTNAWWDLLGTSNLTANGWLNLTNWAWILRTYTGETNVTITNLWPEGGFFRLGTMLDEDSDGLTTALECSVYHTDPLNPDTDYDGRSDGQEVLDGTLPDDASSVSNVLLGYWRFDTDSWPGEQGQLPLSAANLKSAASWSGSAVFVDSNNPALLRYRDVETNGNANINLRQGSIRFWFAPNWSSTDSVGGTGPGGSVPARLIEAGTNTLDWWALTIDPAGTNLTFSTKTNGSAAILNLSTPIHWDIGYWHQITLTYSATETVLYLDGQWVTNGLGISAYPGPAARAEGFRIGSDHAGASQARGRFDELETFNYVLNAANITNGYAAPCYRAVDVALVVDRSGSMDELLGDGHKKCEAARMAASNFVQHLNFSYDQAALLSFAAYLTVKTNQTLTNDLSLLLEKIGSIQSPDGGTQMSNAIVSAQAELASQRHHPRALPVMVFLSDGEPDDNTNHVRAVANQAKLQGTRFVSVALGEAAYTNFMRSLASSDNDYYYANSTAELTNVYAMIATSICRPEINPGLTVTFDSPANNDVFYLSPTNIQLSATAICDGGTVTGVAFVCNETNHLGDGIQSPPGGNTWTLLWTMVPPGTYTLTVWATNSAGVTASDTLTSIVNALPVVSNVWPANLETFTEVTNVTLSADAADSDGSVAKVDFYACTNLASPSWLGTVTSKGANGLYNLVWSNRPAGTYPVTAVATDDRGASSSTHFRIFKVEPTNLPPYVAITWPTNLATFPPGSDITIVADAIATASNSSITNVEFFVNGNLLGSDTNSPYSITECCWKPGTHVLQAKATDSLGAWRVSEPVTNVISEELPMGAGFWDAEFGMGMLNSFFAEGSGNAVGPFAVSANRTLFAYAEYSGITKLSTDSTNWSFSTLPSPNGYSDNWHAILPAETNVYFAGHFGQGDGYRLNDGTYIGNTNVLRWDGSNVHPVGNGLNSLNAQIACEVHVMAKIGGDLYIGGNFTSTGPPADMDTNVQYIAKLDAINNRWVQVGNGFPMQYLNGAGVNAIAAIGNELYIGGCFTNAGGTPDANHIARLAGGCWTNVGAGIEASESMLPQGPVNALAVCGTNLYVGGRFQTVGGLTNANGIAVWDSVQWRLMNGGVGLPPYWEDSSVLVRTISVYGDRIFVGGYFTNVFDGTNIVPASYVATAVWTEADQTWTWAGLDGGLSHDVYQSVVVPGDSPDRYDLYVCGSFDAAREPWIRSPGMARWRVGYPPPAGSPQVTITNPVNHSIFTNVPGGSFSIELTAFAPSYTNLGGVEFFVDGQNVGGDWYHDDPSYSSTWPPSWWSASINGMHVIKAMATDSEGRKGESKPIIISIKGTNDSILAVDDIYTIPESSPAVALNVLANDIRGSNQPLKIQNVLQLKYNLGRVSIGHDGTYLTYTPLPHLYGTDIFYYNVTNTSGAVDSASVTVNIRANPIVYVDSPDDGDRFLTNTLININSWANAYLGQGQITNLTVAVNGTNIAQTTNAILSFNWQTNLAGFYTFRAIATDDEGFSATSDPVTVVVTNSIPSPNGPIAEISNLSSSTRNEFGIETADYTVIREGFFPLEGQAADLDGDPVSYAIVLFRPEDWEDIGELSELVPYLTPYADLTPGPLNYQGFHIDGTNGVLGELDLSGIPNGLYDLVLRVRGGTDETNAIVRFQLDSQLKIGQFSFSEQDLVIPVNGIPLTVVRTYNSLNTGHPRPSDGRGAGGEGDFGPGWTYAINSMDVELDEERETFSYRSGRIWLDDEDSDYPGQLPPDLSIRTGGGWDVTLTLPAGRRTTFAFDPDVGTTTMSVYPKWKAPSGETATLELLDPYNDILGIVGKTVYWHDGGELHNHDVKGWVLTTQDDTKYEITRGPGRFVLFDTTGNGSFRPTQVYGPPKLTKIKQRSGDTIEISDASISHYAQGTNLTRSVYFERDAAGRITAIYDPIGYGLSAIGYPALRYVYDRNTGNLIQVHRLVNRDTGSYVTNKYHYDNPIFPHYITSIEDPRGVPVARNEYDDSGKLIAVVDADGKRTEFHHSATNKMEIIVDRLGNTNTFVYDLRGNVTWTTNALNGITHLEYDDFNNKTNEVAYLNGQPCATNRFVYDGAKGWLLASIDPLGRTNTFTYDSYGNPSVSTDPLGNTTSNNYDDSGNLTNTVVRDAQNNIVEQSFSIYENGHLVETRNGSNQVTASFHYDALGNLTNTTDANGVSRTFAFDANGNQTESTYTCNGVTVTNHTEYDAAGRVTLSVDALGNTNRTFYTAGGKVDYTVDKFGNTNRFFYDARGNLVQTIYPDGLFTRTFYGDDAKPLLTTDRNGITGTRTDFDALGRATNTYRLTNAVIVIESLGNGVWNSRVGSWGVAISTNSTEYFDNGWVKSRTGPDRQTTRYDYWPDGQLKSVTDPLTNTTFYAYDDAGRQQYVADALNRTNRFEYDAVGRMIKTIYANGSFTTNLFNGLGQRVGVKDQAGVLTQFGYNVSGQLTNVTKPGNAIWSYGYDSYGRLTVTTDSENHSTTNVFDELGRQRSQQLPLGQTNWTTYNGQGQVWKQRDFKGQTLEFRYDQYGRVTNKYYFTAADTTHPSNSVAYAFNTLGQLTNITERCGDQAGFGYAMLPGDPDKLYAGREHHSLRAVMSAWLAKVPAQTRGGALGLLLLCLAMAATPHEKRRLLALWLVETWHAQRELLAGFRSPAYSRRRLRLPSLFWRAVTLLALVCLIGSDPTYQRLWTAQAQCSIPQNYSTETVRQTNFVYDLEGRLEQVNSPEGVINYGYDLATGRLTRTCTANSEVEYTYDQLGRLETVHVVRRNNETVNETTSYTYTKVGSRDTVTLPNQTVTRYFYDNLNRLTNLTHTASNQVLLASYTYQLHSTGRRTNAVEILRNEDGESPAYVTNTHAWKYDGLYRLTNEVSASTSSALAHSTSYEYDKAGNRIKKIEGSETITNAFNANDQLTLEVSRTNGVVKSTTTYLYDANGSLTNATGPNGTVSYTYNLANKLASVTANGSTTHYLYNDQGIRVGSVTGATTNLYLVDANNHTGYAQVLEELNAPGGTPIRSYVIGDDVLAQCGADKTDPAYLLYDGHGSTRQLAHAIASVSSAYHFDAYGKTLGEQFTPQNQPESNLLYCGEQFDTALQFYNLRARWYNPSNGRFNQRDTFAGTNDDPQSLHKYAYCPNLDPINGIDPSGNMVPIGGVIELNLVALIQLTGLMLIGAVLFSVLMNTQLRIQIIEAGRQLMAAAGELISAGGHAITEAITAVAAAAAALVSQMSRVLKAVREAINEAKKLGRKLHELIKMPKYLIIKSLGEFIYAFDVSALALNPSWFVLTYNGPRSPVTDANRAAVNARWGYLRASAPPNYSLDEFPYASTVQGGGLAWGTMVPRRENWVQGGTLGAFYRFGRLRGRPGPFLVVPIPI